MIVLALAAPRAKMNPSPPTRNRHRKKKYSKVAAAAVSVSKAANEVHSCLELIQGLQLSGCAVASSGILVVEGGIRAVNKCNKLVTMSPVKLELVWHGRVPKPSFGKFSVLHCGSDYAARKFFVDHGVSQYWDRASAAAVKSTA